MKNIRRFSQYTKSFESLRDVKKIEVNGVEISCAGDELYFKKLGKTVRFENPKLAESALNWCRLYAEDGKSEKYILDLVEKNLKKMRGVD